MNSSLSPIALSGCLGLEKPKFTLATIRTMQTHLPETFDHLYKQMASAANWESADVTKNNLNVDASFIANQLLHSAATFIPASSISSSSTTNKEQDSLKVPNRRILVPFSGGIASLACAWWSLNQPNVDVYFCHLVGLHDDQYNAERAVLCLSQLMLYARARNGLPVFASESCTKTNRQHVLVLPMPREPFVRKNQSATSLASAKNKFHPLTVALMYRQILNAAQSVGATQIVWGMFGLEREMIESLHSLYSSVFLHQNVFPFDQRIAALKSFTNASIESDRAYGDQLLPVFVQTKSLDLASGATNTHTVAGKKVKQVESEARFVFQTAGASLMPDVGQYVCKCASVHQSRPEKDKIEKEAEPVEDAQAYLTRRAKEHGNRILSSGWCGECIHCTPWKSSFLQFSKEEIESRTSAPSPPIQATQTLLDAYESMLKNAVSTVVRALPSELLSSTNAKKRKFSSASARSGKRKNVNCDNVLESDAEEEEFDEEVDLRCADFLEENAQLQDECDNALEVDDDERHGDEKDAENSDPAIGADEEAVEEACANEENVDADQDGENNENESAAEEEDDEEDEEHDDDDLFEEDSLSDSAEKSARCSE